MNCTVTLTLQHIKAFLSGVFKLAKNHGYIQGENLVRDATVPTAPDGAETYAYSVQEIQDMLAILPEPASTMVATAAFTGLRRSEQQGLVWEGYGNGELRVLQNIVEGNVQECKTRASRAAVPVAAFACASLGRPQGAGQEPSERANISNEHSHGARS